MARTAVAESGEGVLAGIVDRVFEDPARSGGLMVVAMTATAIICNAMFLQNSHRPAPLFATRPSASAVPLPTPAPDFPPAAASIPAPQQPVQRVASPAITPPLPRPAPAAKTAPAAVAPAPAAVTAPAAPAQPSMALVTEIQRGLARLGIYTGTIDGKTGARTSAAIAKYEVAAGFKPTGQPTPELLHALQHPTTAPAAAVSPTADPIAAQLDQSAERRAASIAADSAANDAKAAAAAKAQAAQVQAAQVQAAQAQAAQAKAAAQTKVTGAYRTVQTALNRIGYGPVPVDGTANTQTVDAIRRFELDNGLPVSGEPSDALTARLVTIGAIKPN